MDVFLLFSFADNTTSFLVMATLIMYSYARSAIIAGLGAPRPRTPGHVFLSGIVFQIRGVAVHLLELIAPFFESTTCSAAVVQTRAPSSASGRPARP